MLARALAADPEVLVLVDPTSAVDAHTEARIAERLRDARAGRTTVVTTSSPLMLDRVDVVCFVLDGRLVAEGTHEELLDGSAAYRAVVTREVDSETEGGTAMSTMLPVADGHQVWAYVRAPLPQAPARDVAHADPAPARRRRRPRRAAAAR